MSTASGPKCIGFVVDGNRRWAKARGLPVSEWHREGAANVKRVIQLAHERGVACLYFFLFSTENWQRGPAEVEPLLALFDTWLRQEFDDIIREGARIHFLGERERFSTQLQDLMKAVEEASRKGTRGDVALCLSYGGRAEILAAANRLLREGKATVSEEEFRARLWGAALPDPDLIVRTGGARRLSNFLTWQSVYSELFFTDTLWPDFGKEEFDRILEEFAARERRFGK